MWHFTESGKVAMCEKGVIAETEDCPCGLWVGVGRYNSTILSINGVDWEPLGAPLSALKRVATNGTMWIAIYGGGGEAGNELMYSLNARDWTVVVLPDTIALNDVAWNGEYWVISSVGDKQLFISNDGINWTGYDLSYDGLRVAKWGGSYWVGNAYVSGTDYSLKSFDGINWSVTDNILFQDCAYNGYLWVGGIHTSPDGENWTVRTRNINVVTWASSLSLWAGISGGTIFYSSDGISWTGTGVIQDAGLNDMAWNGKLFICVGYRGVTVSRVLSSSDGINWAELGDLFSTEGNGIACKPAPDLYPPIG